jgi:hypothetical protein
MWPLMVVFPSLHARRLDPSPRSRYIYLHPYRSLLTTPASTTTTVTTDSGLVAGSPSVNSRARFKALLKESHVDRPDEYILSFLLRRFPSRFLAVAAGGSANDAWDLYQAGKGCPHTPTRRDMLPGLIVDGPFSVDALSDTSAILRAWRLNGEPVLVKIPYNQDDNEFTALDLLKPFADHPAILCWEVSTIRVTEEESRVIRYHNGDFRCVVLPLMSGVLSDIPSPLQAM